MQENDEDGSTSSFVFIYSLESSQHNSYVMDINVTDIFEMTDGHEIILTGNQALNYLTMIEDRGIKVFQVQYYNFIKLK